MQSSQNTAKVLRFPVDERPETALEQVVAKIAADARRDAQAYADDSRVPEGGE